MNLGYISAIAYVLVTTISTLFIESRLGDIGDSLSSLFLAMIVTSLFFNLVGFKKIKKAYKDVLLNLRDYAIFCIFISFVWVCSIFGVQKSDALIFNISFFLTSASIANFMQYRQSKEKMFLVLSCLGCAVVLITAINDYSLWLGVLIGIFGGISNYLYRRTSFIYANKHSASALEIMMTRFIPIILVLSFNVNFHHIEDVFVSHSKEIMFFAFISFIIPTYLGQYATNKIGAEETTVISALIFPLCWFGNSIIYFYYGAPAHGGMSFTDLFIAIIAFFIIIYPYVSKLYKKRFSKK